jgi:hypothetical protein
MSAVVDNGKFTATAGGWGWFLGGDGSGVWLGREVLRAVLADLDGLGPATMLTARVATELGVSPEELTPSALTGAVYGGVPAHGAGRFAHCAASAPGDAVATDLPDRAATALAASTRAMLTRVEPGAPTVLAGSVACSPAMVQRLRDLLPENLSLAPNGLVGALTLALRAAGHVVDATLRADLVVALNGARRAFSSRGSGSRAWPGMGTADKPDGSGCFLRQWRWIVGFAVRGLAGVGRPALTGCRVARCRPCGPCWANTWAGAFAPLAQICGTDTAARTRTA